MKSSFMKLGLAALASLAPIALHAQVRTVVSGQTTVTLNQVFLQQLTAFGLVITNDNGTALQNGATTFPITEGTLDLQSDASELAYSGGYFVSYDEGALTYRLLDFALEQTGPASSSISAQFIMNNKIIGRRPVFFVNGVPPGPVPVPPSGTLFISGLTLTLTPEFVQIINSSIGRQIVTAGTTVGTADAVETLNPNGR